MPPKQSKLPVPSQLTAGVEQSEDFGEVATCRAMGVDFIDGASCIHNYSAQNPFESGRPRVAFNLTGGSRNWEVCRKPGDNPAPLLTGQIQKDYRNPQGLSEEFDDLIEQVESPELRQQIKNQLPRLLAAYGRAFQGHYEEVKRMAFDMKKATEMVEGTSRRGKKYKIGRKARDFAKRIQA